MHFHYKYFCFWRFSASSKLAHNWHGIYRHAVRAGQFYNSSPSLWFQVKTFFSIPFPTFIYAVKVRILGFGLRLSVVYICKIVITRRKVSREGMHRPFWKATTVYERERSFGSLIAVITEYVNNSNGLSMTIA
jgi:hypothetical protein